MKPLIVLAIGLALVVIGAGVAAYFFWPAGQANIAPHDLVVWGLWQESADVEPLLTAYEARYGGQITYKKMGSPATYEAELKTALAEGRGPDVFVIHHTWVDRHLALLAAAPKAIVTPKDVQAEFVGVVSADLVRDEQVFALPTSVDSLALYYNKALLAAGQVVRPPQTWTEFLQAVEQLTTINAVGSVATSAAALGTAANVNRAPDIVQTLMLQSGVPMISTTTGQVDIANEAGERAVSFYTDFANRTKKAYTWSADNADSVTAFAAGQTAMMLHYAYVAPTVLRQNPALVFGVAPLPQIEGSSAEKQASFAVYWPFAVSATSPAPEAAWQLVRYLTSTDVSNELNRIQHTPTARVDGTIDVPGDPNLAVFNRQSVSARSWPRFDFSQTDAIFTTMINSVVEGSVSVAEALQQAQSALNASKTTL